MPKSFRLTIRGKQDGEHVGAIILRTGDPLTPEIQVQAHVLAELDNISRLGRRAVPLPGQRPT